MSMCAGRAAPSAPASRDLSRAPAISGGNLIPSPGKATISSKRSGASMSAHLSPHSVDAATVVPNLHAPSGQLRLPGRASAVICIATAAVASNDADDAVAAAAPRR